MSLVVEEMRQSRNLYCPTERAGARGRGFWYSLKQNSSQLLIQMSMSLKPRIKEITPDIFTLFSPLFLGVTQWRSWLRPGTKSRKVAGLISAGVIEISPWINSSGHTMALGSTQPLTEMSTRFNSWRVESAGAYGWQPYHLHVPIV